MHEYEFGQENYGRPKLMRPIRKGVQKCGHTPVFHSARDFGVMEHNVPSRKVPKPRETGI